MKKRTIGLILTSSVLSLLTLCNVAYAGKVTSDPEHVDFEIFVEPNQSVTFTATPDSEGATVKTSIAADGGTCSTGTGNAQTFTATSGTAVYNVTFTVNEHKDADGKICTTNKPFKFIVKTVTVTFEVVARGDDMPDSLPPGVTKDIQVTITPTLPEGRYIKVIADNGGSAENGTTTITAPENGQLTASGAVTIQGGTQTAAGKAGKIKLVGQLDGNADKVAGESKGFSVCAHPVNFRLVGIYNGKNASRYGMHVVQRWDSDDSENNFDLLNKAFRKQVVTTSDPGTPVWEKRGLSTSSWIVATNKVSGRDYPSTVDNHYAPQDSLSNPPTGEATMTHDQHFEFYCERCGIKKTAPKKVADSDFKIDHAVTKNEKDEYQVQCKKTGAGGPVESAVEPGQAPLPPSNLAVVRTINGNTLSWTITWTDNSDIEGNFYYEFSKPGGTKYVGKPAANSTSSTTKNFNYPAFKGTTVTFKLQAINWRGESTTVTATDDVP